MLDETGNMPIAEIQGLRVEFQTKDGPVVGVEDVGESADDGDVGRVGASGWVVLVFDALEVSLE